MTHPIFFQIGELIHNNFLLLYLEDNDTFQRTVKNDLIVSMS